jgi:hypothetical protein
MMFTSPFIHHPATIATTHTRTHHVLLLLLVLPVLMLSHFTLYE